MKILNFLLKKENASMPYAILNSSFPHTSSHVFVRRLCDKFLIITTSICSPGPLAYSRGYWEQTFHWTKIFRFQQRFKFRNEFPEFSVPFDFEPEFGTRPASSEIARNVMRYSKIIPYPENDEICALPFAQCYRILYTRLLSS